MRREEALRKISSADNNKEGAKDAPDRMGGGRRSEILLTSDVGFGRDSETL